MLHTSRDKLNLVNRTTKTIGQMEAILRALNDTEKCADALQRLAAARGSINSLMAAPTEDHIRNHMPRNRSRPRKLPNDLIGEWCVRTRIPAKPSLSLFMPIDSRSG